MTIGEKNIPGNFCSVRVCNVRWSIKGRLFLADQFPHDNGTKSRFSSNVNNALWPLTEKASENITKHFVGWQFFPYFKIMPLIASQIPSMQIFLLLHWCRNFLACLSVLRAFHPSLARFSILPILNKFYSLFSIHKTALWVLLSFCFKTLINFLSLWEFDVGIWWTNLRLFGFIRFCNNGKRPAASI